MIQALHSAGLGVVMDVVYNHTYYSYSWLERTVPGYWNRRWENGSLTNGSGCGCDLASERTMVRKYLVDSCVYWAKEYHIDGFRFDLMALHDVDTMNAIRAALDALPGGEDILMYGEPWQGGSTRMDTARSPPTNRRRACWIAASDFSAITPAIHQGRGVQCGQRGLHQRRYALWVSSAAFYPGVARRPGGFYAPGTGPGGAVCFGP